jgi:hypothetical protein
MAATVSFGSGSCKANISVTVVRSAAAPPGCSASVDAKGNPTLRFNTLKASAEQCGTVSAARVDAEKAKANAILHGKGMAGTVSVEVVVDRSSSAATVSLGRASQGEWFGLGINASAMAEEPFALVVDGSGAVSVHQLETHQPGTILPPFTFTVLSNSIANGYRTVKVRLPFAGPHYDFNKVGGGEFLFITAVGSTPTFGYGNRLM